MGYLGQQSSFTGTQNNIRLSEIATGGQVHFFPPGGYNINAIDVYRNGVKLVGQRDFLALDGVTISLTEPANSEDILEFVIYENFVVANVLNSDGDQTIRGTLTVTEDLNIVGTLNATVSSTLIAGIATEAVRAGIATEAVRAGIATEAVRAGIATEAVRAGIASVAVSAGIATAATSASSLSVGATGTNLNVTGVITATSFVGSGASLTNLNIPSSFSELDSTLFG